MRNLFQGLDYILMSTASLADCHRLFAGHLEQDVLAESGVAGLPYHALWGLPDGRSARAALFGPRNAAGGRLICLEMDRPGRPLKADQRLEDYGIFDIDFYAADPDISYRRLTAAGYRFLSEPQSYTVNGNPVSEVCMDGPDGMRIVFLDAGQRRNRGVLLNEPGRMYGECVVSANIVDDPEVCLRFWRDVLGGDVYLDATMPANQALAKALRIPEGQPLRLILIASAGDANARYEMLHLPGLKGDDLRGRQNLPATGYLGFGLRVDSVGEVRQRLSAAGIESPEPVDVSACPFHGGGKLAFTISGPNRERLVFFGAG